MYSMLILYCCVCYRIELKHSGKILATNTQKFFSDGSSNTFHVFFDHPVQIEVRECDIANLCYKDHVLLLLYVIRRCPSII